MEDPNTIDPSEPVSVFADRRLPEKAVLVGYAALIRGFFLDVPIPLELCAIGTKHRIYEKDGWRIFGPRYMPRYGKTTGLEGDLAFALKYEGLDLIILKRLFEALGSTDFEDMVRAKPTSSYSRRIWFLYEWLTGERLDLEDATAGSYVDAVDTKLQFATANENSTRHRVRNNLPGTRDFCPMVRRTEKLLEFAQADFPKQSRKIIDKVPADIMLRAAAFLLVADSRASFDIESESPPHNRIQSWGAVIGEAGKNPLDKDELLRLQNIVLGKESRFINHGFRQEGGFIGSLDRASQSPLPAHVSARHEDLDSLLDGVIAFAEMNKSTFDYSEHADVLDYLILENEYDRSPSAGYIPVINRENSLDPVIAAATLAFGFVYIHPFEDGNGRIHRYLIHHALTAQDFNPPGLIFPISAAILERIDDYRKVLESYSKRLLPLIDWRATPRGNVEVLNDTGDFYRYFDATPHAEFLYECVKRTIEKDLPEEIAFLVAHDKFKARIDAMIQMPDNMVNLMFNFLHRNDGRFSKRARTKEFAKLTDNESAEIEKIYADAFE